MKTLRVLTGSAAVMTVWLILLLVACTPDMSTPAPTITPATLPVSDDEAISSSTPQPLEDGDSASSVASAAAARTPIPTPTPTGLEQAAENIAARTGLSGRTFLGIPVSNLLDLASTALLIIAGYFIAHLLVNQLLKRIIGRTRTKLDDEIYGTVENELRWLVVILIADFAVSGLAFLGDSLRTLLDDLFFLTTLTILTAIALGMVKGAANHFKVNLATDEARIRLSPVVIAVQRFSSFIVLIVALSIGLSHFDVDTNAFYITLLIVSLVFSLAARDVIADALSGFIILADQPFREGDSLYIKDMDTWGDVLLIGTRTTRILTVDNREIIVPNSKISKSSIVNYNYPDTRYRMETDFRIAYGIDIDHVRTIATEAVRSIKGVLDDEPVDVLFIEFDDSARKVRARWWIETFHDEWHALDRVNAALESAFENAHIDIPYESYNLQVHINDGGGYVSQPKLSSSQEEQRGDSF